MIALSKQKVLFFTRTMKLGGTENVILQLCEILKPMVNKIVVCSCGGVNIEKLDSMGIKHYQIPDIENKNPKVILEVSAALKDIVRKENITVIHTHHRMAAFYVSLLQLYKKCYFVNTSHNTFNSKTKLTRFAYRNARLIACGNMVKKNLVDFFGIPDSQVCVIHNAVKKFEDEVCSLEILNERRMQGNVLIGNIGRLSKQKGMEYFIEAAAIVLETSANASFAIIGDGEDREKLEKMVHDKNIQDKVFFLGYRSDIQNIMSQLDFVVLSSLWEGLPLTPIEAYSVGKTVIGTAVDGTTEIIRDGVDGYLVEPYNSNQIAEKIIFLMENPDIRHELEKKALERYNDEFSFDKFSERYISFYRSL